MPDETPAAHSIPAQDGPATSGPAGPRMAWLDGLRAVAVLLVVYAHLSHYLFRGARAVSAEWLHAGTAGVMLFFLVSGYIIPASLERHGSLRSFWVSRLCRLMPLYLVVAVLVLALGAAGLVGQDPFLTAHPWTATLAHLSMLPHLLGVPLVTPLFWTLTFEMAFYLLVSALFAVRRQRADGLVAIGMAAVAVATAPLVPLMLAPTADAVRGLTLAVTVVLGCALAGLVSGRRRPVVVGGLVIGAVVCVLLVMNQDPSHRWEGLLIVAVMFVGTTVHRADHGQVGWWWAGLVAAVVTAALLTNWYAELDSLGAPTVGYRIRGAITVLVFAGAFVVGLLTRRSRTPRLLAWLGRISYSVYLLHWVLIQLLRPLLTGLGDRLPAVAEVPVVAAFLGLLFALSWLTHRFVEVPGQRLGRRWARSMTVRWGSDARLRPAGSGPRIE